MGRRSSFHPTRGRGATIVVNLSASDETIGKADYRRLLVKSQSGKNICAYVYADAGVGESTTDMVFSGHNLIAENGSIAAESKPFAGAAASAEIDVSFLAAERQKINTYQSRENDGLYATIGANFCGEGELSLRKVSRTPFVPEESALLGERAELILSLQAHALAKRSDAYERKDRGSSAFRAVWIPRWPSSSRRARSISPARRERTLSPVTMPGFGTTGKTYRNSLKLIDCVGASGHRIDISKSVLQHFEDIGHARDDLDVTYENAQARMRT